MLKEYFCVLCISRFRLLYAKLLTIYDCKMFEGFCNIQKVIEVLKKSNLNLLQDLFNVYGINI